MAVLNKKAHSVPEDAVYIGRGSNWGNPFVMGKHGDRDAVCEQYDDYLKENIRRGGVSLEELAALHGKDLVCFCAPERCHGHTLEKAAAWAHGKLNQEDRAPRYAGVGSRRTPSEILHGMSVIAQQLYGREGYVLRSGGAAGADQAFDAGAGIAEIYRPRGYPANPGEVVVYPDHVWEEALLLASMAHPAWHRCSSTARGLHARNCFQVLGSDLLSPSKFVICWTPDGAQTAAECTRDTGGTGTAIRLADRYGIEVLNLARPETRERVTNWLN